MNPPLQTITQTLRVKTVLSILFMSAHVLLEEAGIGAEVVSGMLVS
ncbi:hypothetical protein [Noviherbaspirillum aerium]|nr:hypothetical protein [Noviherbaspirillum aerium]